MAEELEKESLTDIFGLKLRRAGDTIDTLEALGNPKFIGVYFGAHWAPPCRLFN